MRLIGYKSSVGEKIFDSFNIVLMVIIFAVSFYPFLYIFNMSVTPYEITTQSNGILLFPKQFTLKYYIQLLGENSPIIRAYGNTIFITVTGTVLHIVTIMLASYPLSKKFLPGKNFFNIIIFITMIFGGGMIPTYILINTLNLNNNLWSLVLPIAFSPFNFILVRNYLRSIPESLEESAHIEGCGPFRTLLYIIIPLSKPILATIALFAAVGQWNSYLTGVLYINDSAKWPLQVLLREIVLQGNPDQAFKSMDMQGQLVNPESLKMAAVMLTTLPILIVYPFIQKYFISGIMLGSVKE